MGAMEKLKKKSKTKKTNGLQTMTDYRITMNCGVGTMSTTCLSKNDYRMLFATWKWIKVEKMKQNERIVIFLHKDIFVERVTN